MLSSDNFWKKLENFFQLMELHYFDSFHPNFQGMFFLSFFILFYFFGNWNIECLLKGHFLNTFQKYTLLKIFFYFFFFIIFINLVILPNTFFFYPKRMYSKSCYINSFYSMLHWNISEKATFLRIYTKNIKNFS